jgi:hypothetical protein
VALRRTPQYIVAIAHLHSAFVHSNTAGKSSGAGPRLIHPQYALPETETNLTRSNTTNAIWTAINVLANTVAIIVFLAGAKGHGTLSAQIRMYVFAILSFLLLVLLGIQHQRGVRNRRIVKAFESIRWTYVDLQDLAAWLNDSNITAEKIQQQCAVVVDKVAKALSEITSTNCSVCIKLVENDLESTGGAAIRPKVITLCRDDSSRHRDEAMSSVDHWIDKNTAFKKLFQNLGTASPDSYFSNNLVVEEKYENTSIPADWKPRSSRIPLVSKYYRHKDWPLPYRSTVVFRIAGIAFNQTRICGFLCADSPRTGIFDRNHDLQILKSMAGCLYQAVQHYSIIRTHNKSKEDIT